MARLCPALLPRAAWSAGDHAELDLLETLERGLSDAYTLFHSVDWARADGRREQHGEIDIVVLNRAGDVLLMEVKSGEVEFRPDGVFKRYGARTRNVTAQIGLQYGAIRQRLQDSGLPDRVSHLLVLTDVAVRSETVQWPRQRIVDSGDLPRIVSRVTEALGPGEHDAQALPRVVAFFENRFRVEPDVSALAGRVTLAATRMSAGLATWVPRIEAPGGVVRVVGTAGSGKSQLALRLLREADAAGRRAAYLCFNRPLADHMARLAPVRTPAETFHEFALRVARRDGIVPDLGDPGSFAALADHCLTRVAEDPPDLDLIVLDEVQDLQPEWVQALLGRLRPQGRAVLLEDPAQQLYKDRAPFDIEGAVTVRSDENFRSPRVLVRLINALRLTGHEIEPLSAWEGELPDPIVADGPDEMARATERAVQRCLDLGHALGDIAVVSLKGRERSALQQLERLGRWPLRRFTGRFDAGGAAIWTDGDLLIESVRRFKGQAALAVVLTECEGPALDDMTRRLLFVGMTRARMHLEWVVSPALAEAVVRAVSLSVTGSSPESLDAHMRKGLKPFADTVTNAKVTTH